jgi:hypothetical protein
VPQSSSLPSACSPRPTNIDLPQGWHEVPEKSLSQMQDTILNAAQPHYPISWGPSNAANSTAASGSLAQGSSAQIEGPVNGWRNKNRYEFERSDGKIVQTDPTDWEVRNIVLNNETVEGYVYTGKKSGIRYYTLTRPG